MNYANAEPQPESLASMVMRKQDEEITALRAELEQAKAELASKDDHFMNSALREHMAVLCDQNDMFKATIARQRARIEATGHRSGCFGDYCMFEGFTERCKMSAQWHRDNPVGHAFQPGPCNCGWAELVGG